MGNGCKTIMILLSVFVYIFSNKIQAQDTLQSSGNFIVGAFIASTSDPDYTFYNNYHQVEQLGVNSIFQRAVKIVSELNQPSNFDSLMLFPYIYAANDSGTGTGAWYIDAQWQNVDWISYFTSAKYRKWEAEGDPLFNGNVKIRQEHGDFYTDPNGTSGYKTTNQTQIGDTIIKGPNYYQYPRYTYTQPEWNPRAIQYIANFRLKIDSPSAIKVPVCSLFVTTSYYDDSHQWREDTLATKLLTTDDLDTEYVDFPLGYNYSEYFDANNYPQEETPIFKPYSVEESDGLSFNIGAKVQFKIQWLGNKQLFIDRIEVYDGGQNGIWSTFFKGQVNYNNMVDTIISYNDAFTTLGNKLKYYFTMDEPHSIDSYEPLRMIQHILDSLNINADLLTHFYPEWNGYRDGDPIFPQYVALAQPKKLFFWYAPFTMDNTVNPPVPLSRDFSLYHFRANLQSAYLQQPGFFLAAQTFGSFNYDAHEWNNWMLPTPSEVNAEMMLSLAHGCQGIYYENYYSYCLNCENAALGLVNYADSGYSPRDIWYTVQTLTSRLKGNLGKTLMTINYDANNPIDHGYLRLYPYLTDEHLETVLTDESERSRYLELYVVVGEYTPVNFHAGFFKKESDNNYFLLTNVITSMSKIAGIKVFRPTESGNYVNIRFRNIEPQYNFDSTFTDSMMIDIDFPAGEGYLFQVAPVVKYGGKLYASETITNNTTLYDDMIVENGATLTVNATYECYGNIYTKGNGKIVTTSGGTIIFRNGKGIISEGYPQLIGTTAHKLTLDFGSKNDGSGVQLLQNSQFIMNYCILKNAVNLVSCNLPQFQTSINHCEFQNTSGYAVSLSGGSTRVPGINYSSFTNTDYGIFGAGQSSFTISYNTFTDNRIAINLSQISSPQIIGNSISSDQNSDPGILLSSCGGNIRANNVSGHSIGVSLANSSPQIGDNQIEDNYVNGIYVGIGSVPDLRGAIVGRPPIFYPISGYNLIQNNGGYRLPYKNDDGSEIYFGNSTILIDYGCNYIADNRTASPPLLTTLYLMNGSTTTEIIQATNNAWGDTVYSSRFGDLIVNFTPYNDTICLIPQTEGMLIMSDNDGNTLDTLYSAGTPEYTPTSTDLQYSEAEEDMINRDYSSADALYNTIISNSPGSVNSQNAYLNLYKSKRLQNADSTSMASLREMFTSNLGSITDSVMNKVVSQLSLLTLVDQRQYPQAINGFADIILQNPETEEALFAEIDAMTTSLLAGNENDTTLGKGLAKSLLVKGFKDYQDRMNKLIHKKFGAESNPEENQIIPTQYSLYNNYPNPFNPTTTIRFDIPERTNVELIVYDILGRKVKSLISNEIRNPGRYEVSFEAGSLASGVYIYRLTTKNYSQARKMLLMK